MNEKIHLIFSKLSFEKLPEDYWLFQILMFPRRQNLGHCIIVVNASRPLLRCRPRAQYEVHELPLFVEKSRSCRVVQERALVQHEQVASKKNSLHEHTRALHVIATRRLFYDELNAMPLGWRCDENQLNIFFN